MWVLTALLCLSVASKAQGYPLYGNSPLYGPGKLYARGLVPLSAVYEIGTLALLYVDRPIGVVALFAYIGGTPSAGRWPRVGAIASLASPAPKAAASCGCLRRRRRSPWPPFY